MKKKIKIKGSTINITGIDRFDQYVLDCKTGKQPLSSAMKMIIDRHISDMERDDIFFDVEVGKRILNVIETSLRFNNGDFVKLFPYQVFAILSVYCWKWTNDGSRRFSEFFYMLPRGGAKSFLGALLAFVGLLFPEPNDTAPPNCVMAANTSVQAGMVFGQLKEMLEESIPSCRNSFILPNSAEKHRGIVKFKPTKGKALTISSDAKTKDGDSVSVGIVDECGLFDDSKAKLITSLKFSQIKRHNPLMMYISTAYDVLDGIWKEMYDYFKDGLKNNDIDDSKFCIIYDLDKEDQENWDKCLDGDNPFVRKVHPAYDLLSTVRESYRKEIIDAKRLTVNREEFKIKLLNIFSKNLNTWIDDKYVSACTQKVDLTKFAGMQTWIGFDGSQTTDLTALSFLFYKDGLEYYKTFYFLPKEKLGTLKNAEFWKTLALRGHLILTNGNTVDYNYINSFILQTKDEYDLTIEGVFYDKYNATQFATNLEIQGFRCVPMSQSIGAFTSPTTAMEKNILSGSVVFDSNPLNRYCFENVTLKYDHNSNCKPDKKHQTKKIDGVISAIQAHAGFIEDYRAGYVESYSSNDSEEGEDYGVHEFYY